jgi:ribonucleoside-triphosphate reductase
MELAAQAHLEKRVFLEKLLALGEQGPLSMLAMRRDGAPLLRLSWTTHQIWLAGLAELVGRLVSAPVEGSPEAQALTLEVIAHLTREAARLSAEHKVHFVLAEPGTAQAEQRLARLDLRLLGEAAALVNGDGAGGAVYYTAGARLPAGAAVGVLERSRLEGLFQQTGVLNGRTDLWLSPERPATEDLAVLLSRVCYQTAVASLGVWPEFTFCLECHAVSRGLLPACPQCGQARVDGVAHETDGLSQTSTWRPGKLAQLRARQRISLS